MRILLYAFYTDRDLAACFYENSVTGIIFFERAFPNINDQLIHSV